MKSTLSLLVTFITSISFFAQSIELSQTQVYLAFDEVLDYDEMSATNTSDATITVAVSVEKQCYNENDGLGIQLCWGDLCYPPTNDDYTSYENPATLVTLGADESTGLLSIHQFWGDNTYGSTWRIYFYNLDDPTDVVHMDVFVDSCSPDDQVSVNSVESTDASLSISPNPATEYISIAYGSPDVKIIFRDLAGRVVHEFDNHNSNATIQLSDYQSGIYLVSVLRDSHVIETQRLVVR
jgi:hypothetical protein